jgi:hypothetical protein
MDEHGRKRPREHDEHDRRARHHGGEHGDREDEA